MLASTVQFINLHTIEILISLFAGYIYLQHTATRHLVKMEGSPSKLLRVLEYSLNILLIALFFIVWM